MNDTQILREIIDSVAREWGIEVKEARLSSPRVRRVSSVCTLMVCTAEGCRKFIVKTGRAQDLERQASLANSVRSAFVNDQSVFLPRCVLAYGSRVLISETFIGRSLDELSLWAYRTNPLTMHRRLRDGVVRAGTWLGRFHRRSAHSGSRGARPLSAYLDRRQYALKLLTSRQASRLCTLVEAVPQRTLVKPHGDFSPHNVLLDQHRICVIDFGVGEWTEVTPAWDVATMAVGIEKLFTSWRSPLHWLPRSSEAVLSDFLAAYGGLDLRSPEFLAAAALRHLAGVISASKANPPAAAIGRWHKDQLDRVLAQAG